MKFEKLALLAAVAVLLASVGLSFTLVAVAQLADTVIRSSSPSGFSVQGDAAPQSESRRASGPTAGGPAAGGNKGAGAAGMREMTTGILTSRSSANLKGDTRIDAQADKVDAIAAGKGNKADNSVGSIGGR